MIKAIIFDVFGTLIDTKDGSVKATKNILEKNNSMLHADEVYAEWKKYHAEIIAAQTEFAKEEEVFLQGLKRIYQRYSISGNADEEVEIMLASLETREAFAESVEVIGKLREKYKVYIGSNTDNKPLKINLERNSISVDKCYTSEDLKSYKPRNEFFTQILEDIGCCAEEVIYVGDSQVDDILGAKSMNIKTVWINRKKQKLKEGIPVPDYEIIDLREMLSFL